MRDYSYLKGNTFNRKHGRSFTPEYESWAQMRKRCLTPTNKDYPKYGGRGVTIYERWSDFNVFLEDMGYRPPGTVLDREDVNGDYEPANCRWVPIAQSNRNKRSNIRVQFSCQSMTLKEACRLAEVSYPAVHHRMKRHDLTFYQALQW